MRQAQAQPPKKSARRRSQNAVAQRNYRARQKEHVKELERLAAINIVSKRPRSSVALLDYGADVDLNNAWPRPPAENGVHTGYSSAHRLTYSFLGSCFHDLPTDAQRDTLIKITCYEKLSLRDFVKYGIISLGYAMDPILYESSQNLPLADWMENVASSTGGIDLLRVVSAGIRLVSSLTTPAKTLERRILDLGQCGPPLNCIQLRHWSYGAAIVENARHFGLPVDIFFDDDALSPFHVQSGQGPAGSEARDPRPDGASSSRTVPMTDHLSPHLKPTAIQLITPHHPCYDLLPWPVFRSKAIMAVSANPPLIDEEDFCVDILNDGIFCWGSTGPSMHGKGGGVPWDSRSWEAAPWFLQKWATLTGGKDGEMWRTSEWWRDMRG